MKLNQTIRYQYDNHLDSACLELDENAAIISYEEYHPFGTTSYRSGRSNTEVSLKRYKYVGKERDEETGLYYYGARYYAAWLCRFVSVDPLQFEYPQLTPYNYAGNKPITHIDIDGMQSTGDEKRNTDTIQKMPLKGISEIVIENNPQIPILSPIETTTNVSKKANNKVPLTKKNNSKIDDRLSYIYKLIDLNAKKIGISDTKELKAIAKNYFNLYAKYLNSNKINNKTATPWMDYAKGEIGQSEIKGSLHNPRIVEYLKSAGNNSGKDETHWCAAFVHWSLAQAGINGAGAGANNYLNWGVRIEKPQYGAIAVFKKGHVGFYMGTNKDGTLKILHGNWSNKVKISSGIYDPIYEKDIKEYRFPKQ